ncbi:hypothetical protein VTJ04DRAFT_2498 [Mycothermus thermophilus]|uniref:uncharacterized protein n=1 Tax=Humicola insolens TaxID=85995 RepID=UPI003743AADA
MDPRGTGSVKRARERAAAGLPRPPLPPDEPQIARPSAPRQPGVAPSSSLPRGPRQPLPFPLQTKDGQPSVPISRPTPAPQWPLPAGPIPVAAQPPMATGPAPPRPQRPSRVPSILDASRVQEQTPSVFPYRSARDSNEPDMYASPTAGESRPSTLSSLGSIPDFPIPMQLQSGPPRRSVTLGPPPSARRGASSFYSNASFVSPIPEESPRTRSRTSIASSAAMPDNWGTPSPGPSPDFPDNDMIPEESAYGDDDVEEMKLVRSASVGKRAKSTLVTNTAAPPLPADAADRRKEPFQGGTGYVDESSGSDEQGRNATGDSATPDGMVTAYDSASSEDPTNANQTQRTAAAAVPPPPAATGWRSSRRLSALRRPPRLDIDAVRAAESRGSLTSLPDLIRRATRLAASLEKGRRPASTFEQDDFPNWARGDEKHQSGFSDMLAAFPPPAQAQQTTAPAQRRGIRDSIRDQVGSWPLPLNINRTLNTSNQATPSDGDNKSLSEKKRSKRTCCGLPRSAVIVTCIIALLIIIAAVVVPIEFFVIRPQENSNRAERALQQCQQQLPCANGGSNVVSADGLCTCRCINGFSGPDCTVLGDPTCTTIALPGSNDQITIGDAIPRLVRDAQTNFSIPLDAGQIISQFERSNLSCSAENALVTFDGRATRQNPGSPSQVQAAFGPDDGVEAVVIVDGVLFTTVTVIVAPSTTVTLTGTGTATTTTITPSIVNPTSSRLAIATSASPTATATRSITTTRTMSSVPSAFPTPGAPLSDTDPFPVSENALDFARVAVLYVLQQNGLGDAEQAQVAMQTFFTNAAGSTAAGGGGSVVTVARARNVTIGEGRSVDLVGFAVDLGDGKGRVGGSGAVNSLLRLRSWVGEGFRGRRWRNR